MNDLTISKKQISYILMAISLLFIVTTLLGLGIIAPVTSHSKEPHPYPLKPDQVWRGHVSSGASQLTPPSSVNCQDKPQADLPFCR